PRTARQSLGCALDGFGEPGLDCRGDLRRQLAQDRRPGLEFADRRSGEVPVMTTTPMTPAPLGDRADQGVWQLFRDEVTTQAGRIRATVEAWRDRPEARPAVEPLVEA